MKQPANLLAVSLVRWSITSGLLPTRLVLVCLLPSPVRAWRIWNAFAAFAKHFDLLRLFGSLLRPCCIKTGRISCRAISDSRDPEAGAVVFASLNYSRPLSHFIL